MQHIPYTGIGPAMIGLLRGDVDVMITTPASAGGQVQDGSIRAIAYTSEKLPPGFPKAPTLKESGFDYDVTSWWAMLGPHGIPADVLQKLNGTINGLLKSEEIIKRYHFIGTEPSPMTLDGFSALLKKEVAQWIEVAKFANIKAE
jgi:tripartite-type tricarboxylate transporter receptor subunit TctC